MKKRKLNTVVLSNVHLGTLSCQAGELLSYLNSINPKKLILNGGFINTDPKKDKYMPKSHLDVLKRIIELASKGTAVYYIKGYFDEGSQIKELSLGNISIMNELVLELDGKKAWFVNGDILEVNSVISKKIIQSGGTAFKFYTQLKKLQNNLKKRFRLNVTQRTEKTGEQMNTCTQKSDCFEKTATDVAIALGYKYVVCGHNYEPRVRRRVNKKGICLYLNSGDWVKNLSALEYKNKRWNLYRFHEDKLSPFYSDEELKSLNYSELLASIMISGKP